MTDPTVPTDLPPATPAVEAPGLADAVQGRILTGKADKLELATGGKTHLIIAGEAYTIAAPPFAASKTHTEAWNEVARRITAKSDPSNDAYDAGYDPAEDAIDWIVAVVNEFGDHRFGIPEDEIPAWLGNVSLPRTIVTHWRAIPIVG